MSITKSAVIKIVLKYIGGSPLMQVPTTTIGGFPVAAQLGGLVAGFAGAASAVAAGGLSAIAQNPIATQLASVKDKVGGLASGNFAGLNAALPSISTDPNLTAQYDKLKLAIGGSDGLSGAVAQVNKFQDHTDRLSGLKLSSDSLTS